MNTTALPSPIPKDFKAARSQFLELDGSTAVMNTYLKFALLCLSVVCVCLVILNVKTYRNFQNLKSLIVRINEVGRAEAVPYDSFEYHPQEAEIKYFLIQFVQRHHSRMRVTLKEDYARSLYFLENTLADAVIESNKKTNAIETFLAGQGEEIEVKVKNVSIEDLRKAPYRATVNYEKIYYGADRQEARRETYTATVVFIVKDRVRNDLIPINPLGLTILALHEDQHFDK